MRAIDTVIIGAGQAGLAASRCLTAAARPHVVLERGRIGERWHAETWDSLHLPQLDEHAAGLALPRVGSRRLLLGCGFAAHLDHYACSFGAPVQEYTVVRAVRRHGERFEVLTDRAFSRSCDSCPRPSRAPRR
jgi:putative flavoprotein involved in K+ transport